MGSDPSGWESRKILKFRKNQKLEKPILNLKNGELVYFRPHWIQETQKNEKKYASFWENETQKVKSCKK